ncbi:hypothetical protein MT340_011910 [Staphylococcus sp. NRL 16/872]|uniref:hypothetical protein n=1 Tax=Staphylococcus sp. NRL 16/872 TaxID=2930131 RepID=UPI001FB52B5F|nr:MULTISPECIES: hypothetical protein [unclassified Staphylococcus]MCJ1657186.1 hypothetical protein [Staphylococcus sp. NRL 21/187]MCJ1662925.1 hypothetical protein [Staphylococcus sp. NRL 18/288]MCJ1669051.1 hypothetical protein [Staphylococcus sp. NRL 19/737]WEN69272.1 hypothetical protein MT340_011910 [Staphylococcus sp. NRL 16/872]
MFKHYLIFLEKYKKNQRVAFHKTIYSKDDFVEVTKYIDELKTLGIQFYTHMITTEDEEIESIEKKIASLKV